MEIMAVHSNSSPLGGGNREKKQNADVQSPDKPAMHKRRYAKKPLIILAILVIIMLTAGLIYWLMTRNQESTDDAYTDGNAVTIAAKTSGYVTRLLINDNQRVKKGDLLTGYRPPRGAGTT